MRLLIILFLLLASGFFSLTAHAQSTDASVYEVTDVGADVTADSAAHARDQAIMQAQRSALEQLTQRLGTDPALTAKLTDDEIGALVQNFEVQNERSSPVRYIGTFTVQFRPNAVRNFLGNHSATYNDTRSKPVVVLPVMIVGGHPVLWEQTTKWRTAWESGSHGGGLVPVIVPQGGLDDIALISTEEAVAGKPIAIKSIIDKYQAGSGMVAVINGDPSKPGTELRVELWHYDWEGDSSPVVQISLPVPAGKNGDDIILAQAVRQSRAQLEKDWKKTSGTESAKSSPSSDEDVSVGSQLPDAPLATFLAVTVPIASLNDWTEIQRHLNRVSAISRVNVITLERGMTSIEIQYQGSIGELQTALVKEHLSLMQDPANGTWILQVLAPGGRV